ncbi:lysophospholipid acyltransferase family protein [Flavobacteriales bacterium AH-315-E23]|nr:lysophospholipid acyltransferase family protein [Flavobacteriales bacterium AH-315-E23]
MYYIVLAILWVIAMLPMPLLYLLSEFIYFAGYYLIGYRKSVVHANLRNAYPDKSDEEIGSIAKAFYHNFCDYLVETVKLIHSNERRTRSMVSFENTELIDQLYREGRGIMLLQGHFFNWELALMLGQEKSEYDRYVVYQKLTSQLSEKMIFRLRGRYGTKLLAMYQTVDTIKENESMVRLRSPKGGDAYRPAMYQFGADQSPMQHKIEYWSTFMNQDAAIFLAPERLSKEYNLAVVYLDLQKVGRGKYTIKYSLITDKPGDTSEKEITEAYVKKLEEAIDKNPSNWLWSHKRWKNKKEE